MAIQTRAATAFVALGAVSIAATLLLFYCMESEPDGEFARARADVAEQLGKMGYPVPAAVRVTQRSSTDAVVDMDRQADMMLGANYFDILFELQSAFDMAQARNASYLRRRELIAESRWLRAYYQVGGDKIVFLEDDRTNEVELSSEEFQQLLAHELAHAVQDARPGGLAALFPESKSLDERQVTHSLIEGEAQAVETAFAHGGPDAVLGLEPEMLDAALAAGVERGEKLTYALGRRFMFAVCHEQGWEALASAYTSPPVSTEQLLHPLKLGRDEPTEIVMPSLPDAGARVAEDTLGELQTLALLRRIGLSALQATRAATGWDGDRLVIDRDSQGRVRLVWRTLWDREEDAQGFLEAVRPQFQGSVDCSERWVDLVSHPSQEVVEDALRVLAESRPALMTIDEDARTTEEAEAELSRRTGRHRGDAWVHDSVGLTVPIPEGWRLHGVEGSKVLVDASELDTDYASNVVVEKKPLLLSIDLKGAEEQLRESLESFEVTVERLLVEDRGEQLALLCEYYYPPAIEQPLVQVLLLAYLHSGYAVQVKATTLRERWPTKGPAIEQLFADIDIAPEL